MSAGNESHDSTEAPRIGVVGGDWSNRAWLEIEGRRLHFSDAGFADPLPLILFEERDRISAPDLGWRTDAASALERLAEGRATGDRARTLAKTLHNVAADVSPGFFDRPEVGWAGLPSAALLTRVDNTRGATGFKTRFELLDHDALCDRMTETEPSLGSRRAAATLLRHALLPLGLAAALEDIDPHAAVRFDVGELASGDDWLADLWDARLEPSAMATAVERVERALESAAPEGTTPPEEELRGALDDGDVGRASVLVGTWVTADPSIGIAHPLVEDLLALARRANDEGRATIARTLVAPLIYRAPHAVPDWLGHLRARVGDAARDSRASDAIADLLADALALREPADSWRVAAMDIGTRLLDGDRPGVGLALMRRASDVDCGGDTPASRSVVTRLRRQLRRRYGVSVDGLTDVEQAQRLFLMDARRRHDEDDVRDLARLLFDAVAGAVYEPRIADEDARETFFELHIEPGMTWLESDPIPGGGRHRLRPERVDDSGPGLTAALLFLAGLAAVIALTGYLLLTLL